MNAHMSIASDPIQDRDLLCAAFNQEQDCFSIGYEHGFRVYSTDPMELRVSRDFPGGGIGVAQMLHRTNYIALVGGGRNPQFPENKVIIWDDIKHKTALALEFLSPVLNVFLSRTRIIAILKNKVHVYLFSTPPTRTAIYDTVDNPYGIGALSNNILAFPGRGQGQIQIVNLGPSSSLSSSTELPKASSSSSPSSPSLSSSSSTNVKDPHLSGGGLVSIIRAHRGPIRCLALNPSGTVLATASEIGTIIRLHSTENTALLHEFRRGLDRAVIYSMAFSQSSNRLAVLSDKNTLHIFDTAITSLPSLEYNTTSTSSGNGVNTTPSSFSALAAATNRRHVLGKLPLMPRYFSSEWSFASCRIEGHHNAGILGWSKDDSVIVIWIKDCRWEKYSIVKRESTSSVINDRSTSPETQWVLLREAWRGFEGLSYE